MPKSVLVIAVSEYNVDKSHLPSALFSEQDCLLLSLRRHCKLEHIDKTTV